MVTNDFRLLYYNLFLF
jgi:hypothetical protein